MVKTLFAKNLQRARTHHEFTQQQAANVIGIHRSSLGAYEEGRAEPSIEILGKICKAYGIQDVAAFLWNEEFLIANGSSKNILPPSILEARYRTLRGREKEAVNILLGMTSG